MVGLTKHLEIIEPDLPHRFRKGLTAFDGSQFPPGAP
jgi:hypothetical protein